MKSLWIILVLFLVTCSGTTVLAGLRTGDPILVFGHSASAKDGEYLDGVALCMNGNILVKPGTL